MNSFSVIKNLLQIFKSFLVVEGGAYSNYEATTCVIIDRKTLEPET